MHINRQKRQACARAWAFFIGDIMTKQNEIIATFYKWLES